MKLDSQFLLNNVVAFDLETTGIDVEWTIYPRH